MNATYSHLYRRASHGNSFSHYPHFIMSLWPLLSFGKKLTARRIKLLGFRREQGEHMPYSRLDPSSSSWLQFSAKDGTNCAAKEASWPHCCSEKVHVAPEFFQHLLSVGLFLKSPPYNTFSSWEYKVKFLKGMVSHCYTEGSAAVAAVWRG